MQLPQAWSQPQLPSEDSKNVFLLRSSLTGASIAAAPSCSPPTAVHCAIDKLNAIANELAEGTQAVDFVAADMQLTCSLAYASDKGDAVRSLHPCCKAQCKCSGIWYGAFGSAKRQLVLRIDLRSRGNADSAADKARQEAVQAFQKSAPALHIEYQDVKSGALEHSDASVQPQLQWVWAQGEDAASLPARGWWQIAFRPDPEQLTATTLARACVRLAGENTVRSAPFEVRTKPSEWVLVTGLPVSAPAAQRQAALASLLSACAARGTAKVAQGLDIKQVVAVTGDSCSVFAKLKSRAQAGAVVLGAHALRVPGAARGSDATQQAGALQGVFTCSADEMAAASFPCQSAWSPSGGVLVSHIPSMNTACKEDPSLCSIPVPAVSERDNIAVTLQDTAQAPCKCPQPPALDKPCESPAHLVRRRSQDTASEPDVEQSAARSASFGSAELGGGCVAGAGAALPAADCDWDAASSNGYWDSLADHLAESGGDECELVLPAAVAPVVDMRALPALPTAAAAAQASTSHRRGTKRMRGDAHGAFFAAEQSPMAAPKRAALGAVPGLADLPRVEDVLALHQPELAQADSAPWFFADSF